MADVWYTFQGCGWPAWLCLLFGVLAAPVAIIALVVAGLKVTWAKTAAVVALILALLPVLAGVVGRQQGRAMVDGAVAGESISPEYRETIRRQGYAEANGCIQVGATFTSLPLLLGIGALVLAFALKPPQR